MFKRFKPGTKNPALRMPSIRPIDIGGMKSATFGKRCNGTMFKKKQPTNAATKPIANNGRVYGEDMYKDFGRWDKKEPPFEAPRGEDIYRKEGKGTAGRPKKKSDAKTEPPERTPRTKTYSPGFKGYNKKIADQTKFEYHKQASAEPLYIPKGMDIPSYADAKFHRANGRKGRPPGSLNKTTIDRIKQTGYAKEMDDGSKKYLSWHATGKYKSSRRPGRAKTVRVMSKFSTHYEYPKDPVTGKHLRDEKNPKQLKRVLVTAEEAQAKLNWTHLAPFHSYGGKEPRNVNEATIYSPESRGLKQDAKRRATLPGFRISQEGQRELHAIKMGRSQWTVPQVLREHGYYEYRRNRTDAMPGKTTKLNVAGKMKKYGIL